MAEIIAASILGASFVIGVFLLTGTLRRAIKSLDEVMPQLEKMKDEMEQEESEGEEWKK